MESLMRIQWIPFKMNERNLRIWLISLDTWNCLVQSMKHVYANILMLGRLRVNIITWWNDCKFNSVYVFYAAGGKFIQLVLFLMRMQYIITEFIQLLSTWASCCLKRRSDGTLVKVTLVSEFLLIWRIFGTLRPSRLTFAVICLWLLFHSRCALMSFPLSG